MNIDSTEVERYEELKNKTLTIVPWDEERMSDLAMTDPDMSISKYVRQCADRFGLCQKRYHISGVAEDVKFNKISVKESIAAMCRQKSDLSDLVKLFTVLEGVIDNAVQIETEVFRHQNSKRAHEVVCMHQYISGFCDDAMVYPVKITVEERKKMDDTYIHVVVTIGKLKKELLEQTIKKEALPRYGYEQNATPRSRVSSFTISIADFVKFFNKRNEVLIKNLPDGLLSEKQIKIKQQVRLHDQKREQSRLELQQRKQKLLQEMKNLKEAEHQFDYEPDDYEYEEDCAEEEMER